MTGRVIVFGSLNIDTVSLVEHLPRPGETVLAVSTEVSPGGKGGNQSSAARAAGAEVTLVSAVGGDGERYLRHLGRSGIDTSAVVVHPDALTGAAGIVVDVAAENSIVVTEGANGLIAAEQLDAVRLTADDTLLVQFELPLEVVAAAVARGVRAGSRVVVNPSPWRDDAADILALADVVIVNELEAEALGASVPPERVCRTLGADGARWGRWAASAPRIDPVDTTGAGDAFAGTLAAMLTAGVEPGPALTEAVMAASRACLERGAQRWSSL